MLSLIVLGWLACGLLSYGGELAYWQREFPTLAEKDATVDVALAAFGSLVGPIGLLATLIVSNGFKHGLMFWPESWRE